MPGYEGLLGNYASDAAQALPPIARELVHTLEVADDQAKVEQIGAALARAFMAGASAGQAETIAQAVEQGANVNVEQLRSPDRPA